LLGSFATAQVSVSPYAPTYNFQVLPGSTRQISVNIAGGTQNTVNWSVLSTTGGASATFTTPAASEVSAVSGALATVQVNIGSTPGTCSISGGIGNYTVSSTATVTVQAQSTDDTTKAATFLFNVCSVPYPGGMLANGTNPVIVAPAYQQAFQSQPMTLQSWVVGQTNENVTWSITSQPAGGDGALADTSNRDTVFTASVTGRYTLTATSQANGSLSNTAIVYVSPNPLPNYAATPNQTRPHECYPDPALTGADYEMGAGKAYTTISSTPPISGVSAGTIYRLWNTDTTGSNPSVYAEYFQIAASGTPSQPIIFCGVPDSYGNLPIMDGNNAVGQSGISTGAAAGYGLLTAWAGLASTPYGYWQGGSAGPSYISITGLHLRNANSSFNYNAPGSGSATTWNGAASCVNLRSGSYIDVSGNDMDTCGNGFYSAENAASAWTNITQNVTVLGNHIHGSGVAANPSIHQNYLQSFYLLYEGNRVDNYLCTAQGINIKWRGVEGIFRYNYLQGEGGCSGPARDFDLVDAQDAQPYISFEAYLNSGTGGKPNCNYSLYCLGDTAGANVVAAYQESFQKDFVYGNLIGAVNGGEIHYNGDSPSGMAERQGVLYYYSNTISGGLVFDTANNGDNASILSQRIDARNNIFWATAPNMSGNWSALRMNSSDTEILSSTTNLYQTGSISITPPITGGVYTGPNGQIGWGPGGCYGSGCPWPLTSPLNAHLYGLSNANFLLTSSQPFDSTTYIPPSGSAAIGAGTALSGVLATMPVRWNFNETTSALMPRQHPQTVGAEDQASVLALAASVPTAAPSFFPAAGTYSSAQTVTMSTATPSATIYYTTDGTTPTTSSAVYSGPITVSTTQTVKAIAMGSGNSTLSAVGSATYTINMLATVAQIALIAHTAAAAPYASGPAMLNTTGANFIMVCAVQGYGYPPTSSAVTDSNSNTWIQGPTQTNSGYGYVTPYYVFNPTTGTNQTFEYQANAPNTAISVMAFSGVASGPDQSSSASTSYGTTLQSGSVTPTNANELISNCSGNNGNTLTGASIASPMTLVDSLSGGLAPSVADAYQIQTTAMAVNPTWTVASSNSNLSTVTLTFYSTETPATLAIPTTALAEAFASTAYSAANSIYPICLSAIGGVQPYTWTITSGTLPTGLSLSSSTGCLSGTPSTAHAAVNITFKVTDSHSTAVSVTLPITVASTPLSLGLGTCPNPITGTQYQPIPSCTLAGSGGTGTLTYSQDTTNSNYTILPNGVSLGALSGTISGTDYYAGSNASTLGLQPPVDLVLTDSLGSFVHLSTLNYVMNGDYSWLASANSCGGVFPCDSIFSSTVRLDSLPVDTSPAAQWCCGETSHAIQIAPWIPFVKIPSTQGNVAVSTGPNGYQVMFPPYSLTTGAWAASTGNSTGPIPPYQTVEGNSPASCPPLGTADCHALGVQLNSDGTINSLWEQWQAVLQPDGMSWHDTSNISWSQSEYTAETMPTQDVGSADAAGLPIAAALVTYDQLMAGQAGLIRFTISRTLAAHVWPATAQAGAGACYGGYEDSNHLVLQPGSPGGSPPSAGSCSGGPMGEIYRINGATWASPPNSCLTDTVGHPQASRLFTAMRQHGLILADNGGTGYAIVAADARWNPADLACIASNLTLGNLEPVNVSSIIAQLDSNNLPTVSYKTTLGTPAAKPATPVAATPSFTPTTGTYTSTQTVTIGTATPSATIYYTTNGTTPTTSSPVYSGPITVSATETLMAIAVAAGDSSSPVGSAAYTITPPAAMPSFSPAPGTYISTQTVTIGTTTPSATIYYTTNGTTPTTSSPVYSGPITVSATETLSAIAVAAGDSSSPVGSAAYTITPPAAMPSFTPAPGTYISTQTVTIGTATPSATIYYTTNGTTPTTSSPVYSGPITVSATETLSAIAVAAGGSSSPIGSAAYTITPPASTPSFIPASGAYTSTQTVTISTPTPSATIYYTTNGTTPTTSSPVYSGPIAVSATETLMAIAVAAGDSASAVGSATYNFDVTPAAMPTFSLAPGTYTSAQTLSISAPVPPPTPSYTYIVNGPSTIYYTIDGSMPTTSSLVYSGPIAINTTETIRAIAMATGHSMSQVNSASYSIISPAATPSFSPAAGTYTSTQTVTIGTATPSATIYYTTNGTTPTTSSPVYSGPITVSATETLAAIALATGDSASAVGSATYTISLTPAAMPTFSLTPGTYTSAQTLTISTATALPTISYTVSGSAGPSVTIYYTTDGSMPTTSSLVYSGPITIDATETIRAIVVATGHSVSPVNSATYAIVSPAAMPTFNPAPGTYSSVQTVTINTTAPSATIYYTTNGTVPTTSSAVYYGPITVSASETIHAIAVATGYSTSAVGSAAYTVVLPRTATPVFAPASGAYDSTQMVTISTAVPATIYYTTNGSRPTSSSPVYSGPITVAATEIVKAIAIASGDSTSAEGSADYVIVPPPAATPILSPTAGTYNSVQTVTISSGTPGAIFHYTTDGSRPTSRSPVYSGPIAVGATETVRAIALATGYSASAEGSAEYKIVLPAATPNFSPAAGTYGSAQKVTITTTTPSTTIHYTTNGTTPTTASPVYSGPITVAATVTIKAIAVPSGPTNASNTKEASSPAPSPVGSAAYTIKAPSPSFAVVLFPSSLKVANGHSGTASVLLTPENGYASTVSFSCSGLPPGASCSFSPASVTPAGEAASTTLTVATSTATAALPRNPSPLVPGGSLAAAFCCFGWRKRRGVRLLSAGVAAGLGLGLCIGCGVDQISPIDSVSTVSVIASDGSLQPTASFTLTVL
jgi:hypothetical protein